MHPSNSASLACLALFVLTLLVLLNDASAQEYPTGLNATTISPSQINLHWTAPQNINGSKILGYEIERALGNLSFGAFSNSTGTLFFSYSNATSFTDSGLKPNTTYNYTVFAILSSPHSNTVTAFVNATSPGQPTGLAAKALSFSKIHLDWTAPLNNGGTPITGYEIERSLGNLSFGAFSNSTGTLFFSYSNATSFTDSGLKPNTTYNYTVFAINRVGPSPPSRPYHTSTPQELDVAVNSDNMTGGPLNGFLVELANSKGTMINSGNTPVTFHVTYGAQYVVTVENNGNKQFNRWDDGETNASRIITPTANMTLTAYYATANLPPFNLFMLLDSNSSAYTQDSNVLFQYLTRGDYLLIHGPHSQFATTLSDVKTAQSSVRPGVVVANGIIYSKIADLASQVPFMPKGLGLVFYDYENGTGFSPEFTTNETKSIGYFDQAESAVRQYNANTGGNATLMVAPSYSDLKQANWDWGLAAQHTDKINVQFGGYTKSQNLFVYAPQVVSQIKKEAPNTPVYVEISLLPQRSTPQITSSDIFVLDGDGVSSFLPWYNESNTTQYVTLEQFFGILPRTAPQPPANLTALASQSQVNLSWSSPPGANYSDITGYNIERTLPNSTAWSNIAFGFSNATSYSDTHIVNNTTYTYRVAAENPMGIGSSSNNATITTPPSH